MSKRNSASIKIFPEIQQFGPISIIIHESFTVMSFTFNCISNTYLLVTNIYNAVDWQTISTLFNRSIRFHDHDCVFIYSIAVRVYQKTFKVPPLSLSLSLSLSEVYIDFNYKIYIIYVYMY